MARLRTLLAVTICLSLVALFLAVLVYDFSTVEKWSISDIDGGESYPGSWTQILADPDGRTMHIAYVGGSSYGLIYRSIVNGKVSPILPLTRSEGELSRISMANAPDGGLHIATFKYNQSSPMAARPEQYLRYATNSGGDWIVSTHELDGNPSSCVVAVDNENRANLVYWMRVDDNSSTTYPGGDYLIQRRMSSGSMVESILNYTDDDSWKFVHSLLFDDDGRMHMLFASSWLETEGYYQYHGELVYSLADGSQWTNHTIFEGADWSLMYSPSMIVDSSGKAHVSFIDRTGDNDSYSVVYATNANGSWVRQSIGYAGDIFPSRTSITMDQDENLYIVYGAYHLSNVSAPSNHTQRVLTNRNGIWEVDIYDNTPYSDATPSVAVDRDGHIHILFVRVGEFGSSSRFPSQVSTSYATDSHEGLYEDALSRAAWYTSVAAGIAAIGIAVALLIRRRRHGGMAIDEGGLE